MSADSAKREAWRAILFAVLAAWAFTAIVMTAMFLLPVQPGLRVILGLGLGVAIVGLPHRLAFPRHWKRGEAFTAAGVPGALVLGVLGYGFTAGGIITAFDILQDAPGERGDALLDLAMWMAVGVASGGWWALNPHDKTPLYPPLKSWGHAPPR